MINLNQPTLTLFEINRKQNNVIPPKGSNSFYNIGEGIINLFTIRDNPDNYRFDLYTDRNTVYTGVGNFIISGEINDINKPYKSLNIIPNTQLSVTQRLTIDNYGILIVHGTLELLKGSQLYIGKNTTIIFYKDSKLKINEDIEIVVENGAEFNIYGLIDIPLSEVNKFLSIPHINIDSIVVMEVDGLDQLGDRIYSMTDFYTEMSQRIINLYTQGEKNFPYGRLGYTWAGGNPSYRSQCIKISTLWGTSILGDFKLSVLGMPEDNIIDMQIVTQLDILKDTTLLIQESYYDYQYVRPELYIGIISENNITPGICNIDGHIIVDGPNCMITLDRGGSIHINEGGILELRNDSIIRSTYNDEGEILFIDGTLIIGNIEQIKTFTHDNIVIGDTGKVIIINPDTGNKKLLFSTPNGILTSTLYRLFRDRIDHIEYHISNNNGIRIDQYFEFYNRQMTKWFGDRRIEKAIKDGILVWHDGGYIELDHDIIPWVNMNCTLLQASRLFKTFGSYDNEKLQECVDRLTYAGCGDIIFRFICGNEIKEITLTLKSVEMTNVINHPLTNMYVVTANSDGTLFMRNKLGSVSEEKIINKESRSFLIQKKVVEFPLE